MNAHPNSAAWVADPWRLHPARWWDGSKYTAWVFNREGEVVFDKRAAAPQGPTQDNAPTASPGLPATATSSPEPRPSATPHESRTGCTDPPDSHEAESGAAQHRTLQATGADAARAAMQVLRGVTLRDWADQRWAEQFGIPELTALVEQRAGDPIPLTWLGLRLREMERTKQRYAESRPAFTPVGAAMRPITRHVIKSATRTIQQKRGTRPASTRVLSAAWSALAPSATGRVVYPAHVLLLSRCYLVAGRTDLAWETAAAAATLSPRPASASYVLAEVLAERNEFEKASRWANQAVDEGCTLGTALLHPHAAFRRATWTTTSRTSVPPTAEHFWEAKLRYYEAADPDEVRAWYGPLPGETVDTDTSSRGT